MTREEIIRLANEVDAYRYVNRAAKDEPTHTFTVEKLERFANLVAAAEREACAKIVDQAKRSLDTTFTHCAAAIRARST